MKILVFVLLALLLTACTPMHSGPINPMTEKESEWIVNESLRRLATLYPPAKTKLTIVQSRDNFGLQLIKALRQSGYSINEGAAAPGTIPFAYVMDAPIPNKLYRITYYLDSKTLTRAYTLRKGRLKPLGLWARRE